MLRETWPFVEAEQAAGERVAVARLVEREGPGARPLGAMMAVSSSGRWVGSISGGCVEGSLLVEAREVLASGVARLTTLHPGADRMPWEPSSACSGRLRVLVTPAPEPRICAQIGAAMESGHPVCVATGLAAPHAWWLGAVPHAHNAFVEIVEPRPVLLVVGATDLGEALAALAGPLGRRVVVVDPRVEVASVTSAAVVRRWPAAWLEEHPLGSRDAALVVTHDARIDDDALRALLPGAVGHVAVLGSRRTHAERVQRLSDVPGIGRLVGPAGLDLGGTSVAETALSMLAEVVAVANGRSGGRLVEGTGPVQNT